MISGSPIVNLKEQVESVAENGYIILQDVLTAEQVASVKTALKPWLKKTHMGRNDFEGYSTERVYALLAKLPQLALIVEHDRVLSIIDEFLSPNFLLSSNLVINIHPGETPQSFHADHGQVPNRPRTELNGMSALWAFDDFTEENGATEFIARSHLLESEKDIKEQDIQQVIMMAGSVIVYHGALLHRGGGNNSESTRMAITPQYCQPWLRQLENMSLVVPPERAAQFSPRVQSLLGYSIREPGFMGHVNGLHPKRLFDQDYRGRKDRGVRS